MNPRPFRFGVVAQGLCSAAALAETARGAEAAGFATFLIRDHFIEEPFGHQLGPLTALATVAAVTDTLRIGTMVICNDYRHPVLLAKEVTTLDLLSGGRFELGLGAGFSRSEYQQAGLSFDSAAVRVARFEEAVRVIKGLFGSEPLTFAGRFYTVSNLDSFPKPIQRPHPPILIGAGGRRMLSIAAREADIIGIQTAALRTGELVADPSGALAENVAERIGWIRREAGARFDSIELSILCSVVISEDRRAAAEQLIRERGWAGLPAERLLEMPSVLIGTVDQVVEAIQARRERYGISYYVVTASGMAQVAPVVARLAGVQG